MVREDEIRWTYPPADPPLEALDLLTLDDLDLCTYTRELQLELEALRPLLSQAVRMLKRTP